MGYFTLMYTLVKMDFTLFGSIFGIHFIVLVVLFDEPSHDHATVSFL